jgi:hypothetical protein
MSFEHAIRDLLTPFRVWMPAMARETVGPQSANNPVMRPIRQVAASSTCADSNQGISEKQLAYREALLLWLRWNEAYERVTERMFETGDDPAAVEALMDQMDSLREDAKRLSRLLLEE